MSVMPNYVPRDFKTLNIRLVVNDLEKAIHFYNNAFGAQVVDQFQHTVFLKIEDSIFVLTEDKSISSVAGVTIQLYTGDAEGVFESVMMAGAEEVHPISKDTSGDRSGLVRDLFGVQWLISTHMEDVIHNSGTPASDDYPAAT